MEVVRAHVAQLETKVESPCRCTSKLQSKLNDISTENIRFQVASESEVNVKEKRENYPLLWSIMNYKHLLSMTR